MKTTLKPAKFENLQIGDIIRFVYEDGISTNKFIIAQIDHDKKEYLWKSLRQKGLKVWSFCPFIIVKESSSETMQHLTLDFLEA